MTVDYLVPWLNASGQDGLRNSMLVAPGDGVTTMFSINFAGGYISKDHIKAYTFDPDTGITTVLPITAGMWVGDNQINIGTPVPVGDFIVIYRDTPKNVPLVSFVDGAIMNEPNLDMLAEQAVFVAAEMADRFDLLNDGSTLAIQNSATALSTANTALANSAAAVATADGTLAAASAAQTASEQAVVTANAAAATANGIDGKAQTALDNSAGAVITANAAATTANGIDAKATQAQTDAAAAVATANAASGIANAAATTANGIAGTANQASVNAAAALSASTANKQYIDDEVVGQCRFQLVNSTSAILTRYNGKLITINGVRQVIPAAGVTLAATGSVANTRYYVYVFMNSGVMTLERSTTGYVLDATTGAPIKTGDPSRTLVGCHICLAANSYTDGGNFIGVLSWFNRRLRNAIATGAATAFGFASNSYAEYDGGLRCCAVNWNDEKVTQMFSSGVSSATGAPWQVVGGFAVHGASPLSITGGPGATTVPPGYTEQAGGQFVGQGFNESVNDWGTLGYTGTGSVTITPGLGTCIITTMG